MERETKTGRWKQRGEGKIKFEGYRQNGSEVGGTEGKRRLKNREKKMKWREGEGTRRGKECGRSEEEKRGRGREVERASGGEGC